MKAMLFFDDFMLERRMCLERVWGKPKFVKEIFTDCYPGFLGFGGWTSTFHDEQLGKYVMYLHVYPRQVDPGKGPITQAFAVRLQSDDLYDWPNPVYDVSVSPAWKGFRDVVVKEDGEQFRAMQVLPLAGTPLASRGYVASTYLNPRDIRGGKWVPSLERTALVGFSDDGLHFRLDYQHPWRRNWSDASNTVMWNARGGIYQIFTRPPRCDHRVAIVTTPDFEHYSPITTVLQPDASDPFGTLFYSMPSCPYEDMFIGQLHVFKTDTFDEYLGVLGGRIETELTYSYNGLNWYRTVREPFVGIREYGLHGSGCVYPTNIVRTHDHKLLFVGDGSKGGHGAFIDMEQAGLDTTDFLAVLLYEMRLDEFCSLKTQAKDGVLRTKAIFPKSGEMRLNVRTQPHTCVRVQLLDDATAKPIPGYTWEEAIPISGDHLFARAQWEERHDISEFIDKPVRIEISMRETELFAIRLEYVDSLEWPS